MKAVQFVLKAALAAVAGAFLVLASMSIPGTQAQTTGSNQMKRYISVGSTEDESEVSSTAGVLVGISARNTNATAKAHLKCVNATASASVPGTTTIIYEMLIPAGPGGFVDNDINAYFPTALTCYIVLGAADSATDEVAANEVSYNLRFRN